MAKGDIEYYNGRYKGSLSDSACDALEELIALDRENGYVKDLRHIIYSMSDTDVEDLISDVELCGSELKQYERPRGTLRDYQTIAVAYGYYAGNFILGDEVGTGKTVETAGLINLLKIEYAKKNKDFKYLVLTEKSLSKQMRSELVKYTGEFVQRIPSGEADDLDYFTSNNNYNDDIKYSVVGTHALLKAPKFIAWLEQCRSYGKGFPFDMLVIDESSVVGGKSTTKVVQGYKSISRFFKKIVFLNATPMESRLEIFYNQLNLLDNKLLPLKKNFEKEFCIMRFNGMYKIKTGKYKNQDSFRKLIGYNYFARTRHDKGAVMEGCKGAVIYSPLSSVQKDWLKKTQLNRVVFDCPSYLDPSIEFNETNVPKLGSLDELLKGECADADSILISVYFKEAQKCLSDWLTTKGYSNRILNGDTDNASRDNIIKGFKNKEFKVLLTNVQKGLNFGNCDYCIFYSFDPNPSKMIQFEGRTTRSFDIIGKSVYVLCSEGQEKRQLNDIVRQRAQATSDFTNIGLSVIMRVLLGGDFNDIENKE